MLLLNWDVRALLGFAGAYANGKALQVLIERIYEQIDKISKLVAN